MDFILKNLYSLLLAGFRSFNIYSLTFLAMPFLIAIYTVTENQSLILLNDFRHINLNSFELNK